MPLSIYIHYPFCQSKCPYCDFNSHVAQNIDFSAFATAYHNEIKFFAQNSKQNQVKTIFFGGGTPSLMPISLIESILSNIYQYFNVEKDCEITIEANPTSFESQKFQDLKKTGINRLSMGIQALNDADLKFLGRTHSSREAISAIKTASKIFDNFSFDLIYARPNQSLKNWQEELKTALSFNTKHLSAYQLTIEKGTQFYSDHQKNKFQMPSEELSAKFYQETNEIMAQHNFINYEISNYCQENYQCHHNLAYWQGHDYIGIGAGAHSRLYFQNNPNRQAIMMTHNPQKWLEKATKNHGIQKITAITKNELIEELILMALRLENGVNNDILSQHFNKKLPEIIDLTKLENLQQKGLINFTEKTLKITEKGKLLTNAIIEKVVACQK